MKEIMKAMLDAIKLPAFIIQQGSGAWYLYNAAAADLFGIEASKKSILETIPFGEERHYTAFKQSLSNPELPTTLSSISLQSAGTPHVGSFDFQISPIDFEGKIHQFVLLHPLQNETTFTPEIERLNNILDTQSDIIFRFTPDTKLIYINDAYCKTFQLSNKDVLGRSFLEFTQETEHARIRQHLEQLIANPQPVSYQYQEYFPDKSFVWWEWSDYPITDSNGKVIEFQTVGRIITEKKILEEKLRQSEQTTLGLLNTMPDLVFRIAADGTYLDSFTDQESSYYVPPEVFIGKQINEILPPKLAEISMSAITKSIQSNQKVSYEYPLPMQEGEQWFENRIVPLNDNEVLSVIRNVTSTKRSEEAIRNNERFLRRLFALLNGALSVTKIQELHEYVLPQAKDMFQADIGCLVQWQENSKTCTVTAISDPDSLSDKRKATKLYQTFLHQMMDEGQPFMIDDMRNSPLFDQALLKELPDKSVLGIPLISNDNKYGAIVLTYNEQHEFTITEIERANLAAGILSLIISKNQIYNELHENERLMRSFIEHAPIGIMATNSEGKYVIVNDAAAEMLGYNRYELLGMHVLNIVHPEFHQAGLAHFEKLSHDEPAKLDARLLKKGGAAFWGSVHGIKIHDDLYLAFHFDISDILESRMQLAHEKALLTGLLRSIPDLVYYKDLEGTYIGCNDHIEQITGFKAEQVIGKKDHEILPAQYAEACLEQDRLVLRSGQSQLFEETVENTDMQAIPLETLKAPFYSMEGELIGIVALSRDVSLRKQQEHIIRKNDLLLQELTQNLPGVLFQLYLDQSGSFRFHYISQRVYDYLELTIDQLNENPRILFERIHPEDMPMLLDRFLVSYQKVERFDVELRVILPTDGERWMRANAVPQKSDDQGVVWHGFFSDITERRLIGDQLKKSEERLQSIFNSLHEVIWSVEMPENQYGFISPSCERMFGYTQQEIMDQPDILFKIVHPDDLALFQSGTELLSHSEGSSLEYRIITRQGAIKWVNDRTRVVKDETGAIVRIEGIITDITERKKNEINLRNSEERFHLALQFTEAGLWDWDLDTGKVYYSDTWKSMLGYSDEEIGDSFEDWHALWHPEDAEIIERALKDYLNKKAEKYEVEYRLRCKSGHWRWVLTKGQMIQDEYERPVRWIGTNIGIDRRKKLENDLLSTTALQTILMNLAIHFINLPLEQLNNAIAEALTEVGEYVQADRAYLFSYDFGSNTTSNTHEWCNSGIEPQIEILQNVPVDDLTDWLTAHLANNIMLIENVQELPEESFLRSVLDPQQIKSIVTVPLFTGNELTGFLGFDSVKNYKKWSETEIILLRFMAEIFVNAQQRMKFENALIENEMNLKLATEATGTGIWTADFRTNTIRFNNIFGKLTGANELLVKDIDELFQAIHTDDFATFYTNAMLVRTGRTSTFSEEVRAKKVDGTFGWVHVQGSATRFDELGVPLMASGTINDITGRKNTEIALRESEERFKSIYNNSVVGLYRTTLSGEILMANPALAKLHGYENPEIFKSLNVVNDGLTTAETREHFLNILLENGEINGLESVWNTNFGKQITVRENARLVKDDAGNILFIEGSAMDITEQKKAEEELRLSEEKFRQLAENVDDIFWLRDADTLEIVYINPAFERFTGLSGKEFGKNPSIIRSLVHPDDLEAVISSFSMQNQKLEDYDGEFKLLINGQTKWIRTRTKVIRDAIGKPHRIVGIGSDITRLKEAEKALLETLETEKQLSLLKSRFVSMASHEFRTPLATIQATIETLQAYYKNLTREQFSKRLEKISQQVSHLRLVMDDVLNLAKIQEGKIHFDPIEGELISFVTEICEEFHIHPSNTQDIKLLTEANEIQLNFDPRLMRQVLNNLISNAIKYSPAKSEITLRITSSETMATIEISDQGIGIPEKEIQHLFEPFFRANNAMTIQGTGLGMTITKQAVELHGGTIEAHSQIGVGTSIFCHFPIKPNVQNAH